MRLLRPTDRDLLSSWIELEPEHRGFLPEFWYERNRVSLVIEDRNGPVMFVKLSPEPPSMRLHIQFSPDPSRVAKAMLKHFAEVKKFITNIGAEYIVFDTKNPKLAEFCSKAFGFIRVGDTEDYIVPLKGDSNGQPIT